MKNDTLENCKELGINIPFLSKENIKKATTLETVMRERNDLIQDKLAKNGQELAMISRQKEQEKGQER